MICQKLAHLLTLIKCQLIPFIWVELSLDLQWCNWKQDQPHWLYSSISKYSAVQVILLVFYYVHLRCPLNSGVQTLPFIYSCSQQEDIRIWSVNGKMDISKSFQYLLLCSPTEWETYFSHAGQSRGQCGCSGFTCFSLMWRYDMFIMLVVYVIHTESGPVCCILKVRFLCADCDQRHKKFPFLRKKS